MRKSSNQDLMKKRLLASVKADCLHFKGDAPCRPNKEHGKWCADCAEYERRGGTILIIKLGAQGDVIRTTPILTALRKDYPGYEICWITKYPEVLCRHAVDRILPFTLESVIAIQGNKFDLLINFDKDPEAIGLVSIVRAREVRGFKMEQGRAVPAHGDTEHKWLTGIHNGYSKGNTKSYLEEIFEICRFKFQGEEYLLPELEPLPLSIQQNLPNGRITGLVTGCGSRWPTRAWPADHCREFCRLARKQGMPVLLLGGDEQDEINRRLSRAESALYFGVFPFGQFLSLVNACDLIVTPVTMAMHVAIGLRKQVVLLNNIFNPREFELYGRGEIVEPTTGCECYYAAQCARARACVWDILPEDVYRACLRRLGLCQSLTRKSA